MILLIVFFLRERRLTRTQKDPLVDLRLFRVPSYAAGVLFALAYFPAMAGLPLVLAIYYQDGLGYTALQSGLGVTAYALGSAIGAPLAGRFVTRIGRPLLLVGLASFAVGAITLAVLAGYGAAALAPGLFLMGAGSGAIITPNQALSLMRIDPVAGSTAGGVLQTAQRSASQSDNQSSARVLRCPRPGRLRPRTSCRRRRCARFSFHRDRDLRR